MRKAFCAAVLMCLVVTGAAEAQIGCFTCTCKAPSKTSEKMTLASTRQAPASCPS
jgi:hypothetical protein